ncbi:MAG: hypothetical protein WC325_01030 [Candidatus Bathyarchaeia archaeon]|jgi:hypothetical protein
MSVYTNKDLECSEAYTKNLLRLILLKGQKCCVCHSEHVCVWIVDEAKLARGLAVYVRLFCREHEKMWKDAKRLEYNQLNGVMLIEMPYQKPAGLWTNLAWNEFLVLLTNYFGNKNAVEKKLIPEIVNPCEEFLTKNPKFVLKGAIADYIKT